MKQQLTHRTNVLLSSTDYSYLSELSNQKKKSMGFLIREALHDTYFASKKDDRSSKLKNLKNLGSQVSKKDLTQKEITNWVQEGRSI